MNKRYRRQAEAAARDPDNDDLRHALAETKVRHSETQNLWQSTILVAARYCNVLTVDQLHVKLSK